MKFSKLSQLFLVTSIGLIVASLLTACQLVTIDYVFVGASAGTSAGSAGQIFTYAVDSQSGALRTAAPTVSSGGTLPVAMAVSPDYANLYVANEGNNSVVHFAIANNGVLTQKDSITLPAAPVSLAVNSTGTYLYVVSGTTPYGSLTEYALSSGAIGSPTATQSLSLSSYPSDTIVPTGVNVLANGNAVYVCAYDISAYNPGGNTTSNNSQPGWLFGYAVGSGGALTALTNSPYQAGVKPSAVASDPTNRFVYVTDFATNDLIGYTVQAGSSLIFMLNGPFKTGNQPTAVTVDPRGFYIYLANSLDSTVSGYTISLPTGTPSGVVGASSTAGNTTDTHPVAIIVDPSLARFVYTANYLGNTVSGFRLDTDTGALSVTQATPYPTGANPAALAAVPHGNYAIQKVTP